MVSHVLIVFRKYAGQGMPDGSEWYKKALFYKTTRQQLGSDSMRSGTTAPICNFVLIGWPATARRQRMKKEIVHMKKETDWGEKGFQADHLTYPVINPFPGDRCLVLVV